MLTSLLFQLLFSLAVAHEYAISDSVITDVILFPNIAKVSRTFKVDSKICPGYHTLKLMGLVTDVDDSSLRIERSTLKNVDFLDSTVMTYAAPLVTENDLSVLTKEKSLIDMELRHAQNEMEELNRKKQRLIIKSENTKSYVANTFGRDYGTNNNVPVVPLTIEQATELLAFEETSLKSIDTELSVIQQRELELKTIIETATSKQNKLLSSNGDVSMKLLSIGVLVSESDESDKCKEGMVHKNGDRITVSYYTNIETPAHWSPQYDLFLEEVESDFSGKTNMKVTESNAIGGYRLKLDYYALVSQATGEDWKNVELVLSTVESANTLVAIPPSAMHKSLHYLEDVSMFSGISSSSSPKQHKMKANGIGHARGHGDINLMQRGIPVSAMAAVADADGGMEMMDAVAPSVSVSHKGDLGSFYELTLPHPVTINATSANTHSRPIGGATSPMHRVFVRKDEIPTAVFSYAVPSTSAKAYLRAYAPKYENGQKDGVIPMLSSKNSRLYLNGGFVGRSPTPAVAVGSELKLNFGENKRVEISHTHVLPKNFKKGKNVDSGSFWNDFVTVATGAGAKKMRIHRDEFLISVKNLHSTDHFVVFTENLPESEEEDVVISMIAPAAADLLLIEKSVAHNNDQCLKYILEKHNLVPSSTSATDSHSISSSVDQLAKYALTRYLCTSTSDVYWVKWMKASEELHTKFEYTTTWPEEKNVETTVWYN